jgi:hypothetical protein
MIFLTVSESEPNGIPVFDVFLVGGDKAIVMESEVHSLALSVSVFVI